MPRTPLAYVYSALMAGTAILLLVGLVVFSQAVAFEGYISALLILALALVTFEGGRELKRKHAAPDVPTTGVVGETPSGKEAVDGPTGAS